MQFFAAFCAWNHALVVRCGTWLQIMMALASAHHPTLEVYFVQPVRDWWQNCLVNCNMAQSPSYNFNESNGIIITLPLPRKHIHLQSFAPTSSGFHLETTGVARSACLSYSMHYDRHPGLDLKTHSLVITSCSTIVFPCFLMFSHVF